MIPARAGSKRFPRKNIRKFKGRSLILFSISAARQCPDIHRIIVSTNDSETAAIATKQGTEVMWRPDYLATDTVSIFEALKHIYRTIKAKKEKLPKYIVLLQPTSPLRRKGLITEGLKAIRADKKASCLIAVYQKQLATGRIRNGYWQSDYPEDTRTQDVEPFYVPCGSLYIFECKKTIEKDDAWGKYIIPLIENEQQNVNIDYKHDFLELKNVFKRNQSLFSYLIK